MTQPIRLDDLIVTVSDLHPGGGPLDHLSDAVLVGDRLGETADHLIGHFVDQARRSGATWTEIGAAMGVSKQAAQKRFVPRDIVPAQTTADVAAADMVARGPFTRFTIRARHCIVAAQSEARAARSHTVGTEHLLAGLLAEPEGIAAQALRGAGVSDETLRGALAALSNPGDGEPPALIPFTPAAKKAIELSIREALRLGHDYVGTEHVLLGLLAAPDTTAARLLAGLSVTRDVAERSVTELLAGLAVGEA